MKQLLRLRPAVLCIFLVAAVTRLPAQVLAGAVAAYPFCGNAVDIIGTNNGVVNGATLTADRFGVPANAYAFDGLGNTYINLGTSAILKPVTKGGISVWARPDNFSHYGSGYLANPIIITKNQPGNNCYEGYAINLVTNTGYPRFDGVVTEPFCNQSVCDYNTTVVYQNWYHLVLTWDIDSLWFYVNGGLAERTTKNFPNNYLATDSVVVGTSANPPQNNRFFNGAIDDLVIYPFVIDPQKVAQLYALGSCLATGIIAPASENLLFSVAPNPASGGAFTVSCNPREQDDVFVLYTADGRLVHRQVLQQDKEQVRLQVAEGLYFAGIERNGTKSRMQKLLITR
jgi:hypothetical protein